MSCILAKSNLRMTFLSNEGDFPSLISWVQSMPVVYPPQDYLAIAVVIQQEIEPIIRKEEPRIALQGNDLPFEITQSKGFIDQWKEISPSSLDPAFLPFLNSEGTPLNESIVLTKAEERINKLSKIILLICRVDKDKSTFEYFCQRAEQEINRMRDSIKGSFSVSAQALISDSHSPCFSLIANSAEPKPINQSIEESEQEESEQPIFTIEPRKGLIWERHFDHRENEETTTQLLVELKDDKIITTKKKNIGVTVFADLRYESNESISL